MMSVVELSRHPRHQWVGALTFLMNMVKNQGDTDFFQGQGILKT